MEVTIKLTLDDATASSNVPYPDAAAGEELYEPGTYSQGAQKVQGGSIYEVVASSTSDTIDQGLVASPATWAYIEPANFYKPLRNDNDVALSYSENIEYEVTSSSIVSAVSLFGVAGQSVNVTVTNTNIDPSNPIYNVTQSAVDNSDVYDWVSYWTLPSNAKETFYFNDLPTFVNSTVKATISAPSGTAEVENIVLGELVDLGETLSGMSPQLRSTSRFIDGTFGRTWITRGSVRELQATVKYPTAKHDYIFRRVEQMNDIATTWAGTNKFSTSVVLGTGEASFELYPYPNSDATYTVTRYTSNGN